MVLWDRVTRRDVLRAMQEYDRLGPEQFFSEHGFAPTTTYELVWEKRRYPPKAVLGTAYEFATGQRLASGDFEGGKAGAVKVLGQLGCVLSWNRDPAAGVIFIQSGPRRVGSTLASRILGGRDWNAGCGDDRQDTPGVLFPW